MRTVEEQLCEIEAKKRSLLKARTKKTAAAAVSACLCVIAAVSVLAAGTSDVAPELPEGMYYGSLIASGPFLSYFIVGFIAFLLGISFTMLCIHVNRRDRK